MVDTYNSLIDKIEAYFARPHTMIKSFGEGFYDQAAQMYTDGIGGMFVVLQNVQHLENSVSNFNLRCYFIDVVRNDDNDQREVISDQLQISRDFINWLREDINGGAALLDVVNLPFAVPVKSVFLDYTAGCYVDVVVEVVTEMTDCAIPRDGYDQNGYFVPNYSNL